MCVVVCVVVAVTVTYIEQKSVEAARERHVAAAGEAREVIASEPQYKVNTNMLLDPEQAAYKFTLEIPLPIDTVVLQSLIPVDLLDVDSNVAILSRTPPDRYDDAVHRERLGCFPLHARLRAACAVFLARCQVGWLWFCTLPVRVGMTVLCWGFLCAGKMNCYSASKNMLLATYRCQESVGRLEFSARTVEGQFGDIQAIVIAKVSPAKSAQIV